MKRADSHPTPRTLADMEKTAQALARMAAPGDVICLYGDLGAGKTTFARFFLQALGVKEAIPSPTFTLVQAYDSTPPAWHFDLYRMARPEEIRELGLEEALEAGVVLIEWPERLGEFLPKDRLEIHLSFATKEDERLLQLKAFGAWQKRRLLPLP